MSNERGIVYESGMPRMQEVTPPEVEVTDDTGTVIEQLTNTATQLDGTEDVLEQLDVLDKESTSSVGAAPTIATDAGTVTAVLITPSAYALVADADTRLGTASVVAVGQHQDARLEAAQKAIDEELSLHPTVFQKSNNSGVNSAGFRHVKLLTNRGNCFQASLSQTSDRAAWCGPKRPTPEEASLDVARRLRDFPPKSQTSLQALSATALQEAASEKLGLLLKDDGSFYDVTEKPCRKEGGGFPVFEARLSLKDKGKRSLGRFDTKEQAAVALARASRDTGVELAKRRCTRVMYPHLRTDNA